MTNDPTLVGLVTGGLGLVLLLSVLVVRALRVRRRRRATSEETSHELVAGTTTADDVAAEVEETSYDEVAGATDSDDVAGDDVAGEPIGPGHESLVVRSLRAQVRTLEQTIEDLREVADRIPATDPADVPADEEPAASYRHQVSLTLRALAARPLPGETAAHALARVVAAVERLDGADRLERPALPPFAGVTAVAPAAFVPGAAPAAPVEPAAPAAPAAPAEVLPVEAPVAPAPLQSVRPMVAVPTWTEPVGELADEPAATDLPDAPAEQVDPADLVEVVLPVPPPMTAEPRRNRRWLRRHAA